MHPLPPALAWSLAAITVIAAAADLRWRVVPNWLVVAGLAAGFSLNTIIHGGSGLRQALLGFALALVVYLPLFALRAMGGGDVKLMAVVGCIAGPGNWLAVFAFASVISGILALILIIMSGISRKALHNLRHITRELIRFRAPWHTRPELDVTRDGSASVPHAFAIALAALILLLAPVSRP